VLQGITRSLLLTPGCNFTQSAVQCPGRTYPVPGLQTTKSPADLLTLRSRGTSDQE